MCCVVLYCYRLVRHDSLGRHHWSSLERQDREIPRQFVESSLESRLSVECGESRNVSRHSPQEVQNLLGRRDCRYRIHWIGSIKRSRSVRHLVSHGLCTLACWRWVALSDFYSFIAIHRAQPLPNCTCSCAICLLPSQRTAGDNPIAPLNFSNFTWSGRLTTLAKCAPREFYCSTRPN